MYKTNFSFLPPICVCLRPHCIKRFYFSRYLMLGTVVPGNWLLSWYWCYPFSWHLYLPPRAMRRKKNISVNSLTNFLNLKRLSRSIFPSLMMKKSWRSAAEPESSSIIIALSTHNAVLVCVSSKRRLPVSSIPLSLVNLVRILCILFWIEAFLFPRSGLRG